MVVILPPNRAHYILFWVYIFVWPILVATRSKVWFCVRLFSGIAGSNPAGVIRCLSVVTAVYCLCDELITYTEVS
jgi:hypothetical protein